MDLQTIDNIQFKDLEKYKENIIGFLRGHKMNEEVLKTMKFQLDNLISYTLLLKLKEEPTETTQYLKNNSICYLCRLPKEKQ